MVFSGMMWKMCQKMIIIGLWTRHSPAFRPVFHSQLKIKNVLLELQWSSYVPTNEGDHAGQMIMLELVT